MSASSTNVTDCRECRFLNLGNPTFGPRRFPERDSARFFSARAAFSIPVRNAWMDTSRCHGSPSSPTPRHRLARLEPDHDGAGVSSSSGTPRARWSRATCRLAVPVRSPSCRPPASTRHRCAATAPVMVTSPVRARPRALSDHRCEAPPPLRFLASRSVRTTASPVRVLGRRCGRGWGVIRRKDRGTCGSSAGRDSPLQRLPTELQRQRLSPGSEERFLLAVMGSRRRLPDDPHR